MLSPRPDVDPPAGEIVGRLIEADDHVLGDRGNDLVHLLLHLRTGVAGEAARRGRGGLGHNGGDGLHLALEAPCVARLDLEGRPDLSGRSSSLDSRGADRHVGVGDVEDTTDHEQNDERNTDRLEGHSDLLERVLGLTSVALCQGEKTMKITAFSPWQS